MANFPTSVYSPASKSAGQTIQASHPNDLDSEVNAIEDGYLNGTARLNSSNSTIVNLSIAGNCTVAGNLIAGNSTVGNLSITGSCTAAGGLNSNGNSTVFRLSVTGESTFAIRPMLPPPDAVKVFLASTRTLGSSAVSTIAWNAQEFLTNSSMHSTGTNPERLTPQTTGVYQFAAQTAYSSNSTARIVLKFADSSGTIMARGPLQGASSLVQYVSVMGLKRFDALGGYVVVLSSQQSGVSTLSILSSAENSWAAMWKL